MSNLKCADISKKYEDKLVVDNVTIKVDTKQVIGLLGPNGAGKTTTFYMLVGLIRCNTGMILLNDEEITNLPMHKRSDLGISYLPQEASIFRNLTVKENIMAILETRKSINTNELKKKFDGLVDTLQISNILDNSGASLSGGERRRVEIARSLATNPRFLLLDEPFAGIDPISVIEIQKIIKTLVDSDIGVLITDHNVRETLKVCNEAYILSEGKVIAHGEPSKIIKNKVVQNVYLGDSFKL
ncbi:MAG: LPS export ABC transporter ATP-binding protein [Gammaproteobacteria bacterium]|nr:LPS export ABC transporter ATP-binding protein [Gammaproteobacteria bacterium]